MLIKMLHIISLSMNMSPVGFIPIGCGGEDGNSYMCYCFEKVIFSGETLCLAL